MGRPGSPRSNRHLNRPRLFPVCTSKPFISPVKTYLIICFVVVTLLFWGGFFGLVRVAWRHWRSKRRISSIGPASLAIGLLWFGLLIGVVPGSSTYKNYRLSTALFGQYFPLGPLRQTSAILASVTGDGIWIKVHDIPDELAHWAESPPPEFQTSLPKCWGIPPWKWQVTRWHPTPLPTEELKFLEGRMGRDDETAISLYQRLMKEPGSYVAFECYWNSNMIRSVTVYVLCPANRILIHFTSAT